MGMRVLLVEDEAPMGRMLRRGLQEAGFRVDLVDNGEDATAAALTTSFDVISLDVMIPGHNGFDVCAELRRQRVETPVLMLTARDAVEDRVRGLDCGADDYLVKPFAFPEYVARLRALTRRHLAERAAVLEAGELRLDTNAKTVTVGGRPLSLTAKEFGILEYLVHNRGRYLTRNQIAEHVWDYDFAGESNLVEVYVGRLRRKLAAAGMTDPIFTQRNAGYRFEPQATCEDSSGAPASG